MSGMEVIETTVATNFYTYTPLIRPESIRVLVLHPSESHTAPLLCDIVHDDRHKILLDIEQKRDYETVSYTWGDPIFSHEIFCGDEKARLSITPNVDSLLRNLRKPFKSRGLWVDAICLNQTNYVEKRIQVALMGEIYRQGLCQRSLIYGLRGYLTGAERGNTQHATLFL